MKEKRKAGIFVMALALAGVTPGAALATETALVGRGTQQYREQETSDSQDAAQRPQDVQSSLSESQRQQVQELLASMSREEKAGQMLMVSPSQLAAGDWTQSQAEVLANVNFYHIGSIVFLAEDLAQTEAAKALKEALAQQEGIQVLVVEDAGGSLAGGFVSLDGQGVLTLDTAEEDMVLVSDSLTKLEADQESSVQVTVSKALQEGYDILALPSNVMTAYFGITSTLDEQLVTEEQIDDSVQKILEAKAVLGLLPADDAESN